VKCSIRKGGGGGVFREKGKKGRRREGMGGKGEGINDCKK